MEIGLKPTLTAYATLGFHGTSEERAQSILENGVDLSKCSEGLYGRGFYVYEDLSPHPGGDAARAFVKRWREGSRVAVVTIEVRVADGCALDLVSDQKNRDFFDAVQRGIVEMATAAGQLSKFDNPMLVGTATVAFIIRFGLEARTLNAVRATFQMPSPLGAASPDRSLHQACKLRFQSEISGRILNPWWSPHERTRRLSDHIGAGFS